MNKNPSSTQLHFVGIGGSGMCGIAEIFIRQGYQVSGSDIAPNRATSALEKLGATIYTNHNIENIVGADVVVYSSAIEPDNVELVAARAQSIAVMPRVSMLAELMRFRYGIAVAGTHGKTTTTSMIATIFSKAQLAPTFVIGGLIKSADSNAKLGCGKYMITEVDESDASFLALNPMVSVITNIEPEHLAAYNHDFSILKQAFIDFIHRLPFYGVVVMCLDDPVQRQMIESKQIYRRITTYGFSQGADFQITQQQQKDTENLFCLCADDKEYRVQLPMPGKHNCLNATASIALSAAEGLDIDDAIASLAQFPGVARRFDILASYDNGSVFIDDYGHHPKEIEVTLETVRAVWPDNNIFLIFQPHRPSRTRDHYDDFVEVLSKCDKLIMLDIYNAGENDIAGIDSHSLGNSIRTTSKLDPVYTSSLNQAREKFKYLYQEGDIVLTMGAGDITTLGKSLLEDMQCLNK